MSERVYTDFTDEAQAHGLANAMLFTAVGSAPEVYDEAYEDVVAAATFLESNSDDEILAKQYRDIQAASAKISEATALDTPMDIDLEATRGRFLDLTRAMLHEDEESLESIKKDLNLSPQDYATILTNFEDTVWPAVENRDYEWRSRIELKRKDPEANPTEDEVAQYAQELAFAELVKARSIETLEAERQAKEAVADLRETELAILCLPHIDTIRAARLYRKALDDEAADPLAFVAGLSGFLYEDLDETKALIDQGLNSPHAEVQINTIDAVKSIIYNSSDYPPEAKETHKFIGNMATRFKELDLD